MITDSDAPSIAPSITSGALHGAMQVEQCTYVRTYSQRTTHLDYLSHVAYRAQGGSKNFPLAEVNPATAVAPRGLEVVGIHA